VLPTATDPKLIDRGLRDRTGELSLLGGELRLVVTPPQPTWPMIPNNRAVIARVGAAKALTLWTDVSGSGSRTRFALMAIHPGFPVSNLSLAFDWAQVYASQSLVSTSNRLRTALGVPPPCARYPSLCDIREIDVDVHYASLYQSLGWNGDSSTMGELAYKLMRQFNSASTTRVCFSDQLARNARARSKRCGFIQ